MKGLTVRDIAEICGGRIDQPYLWHGDMMILSLRPQQEQRPESIFRMILNLRKNSVMPEGSGKPPSRSMPQLNHWVSED